MDTNQLEYRPPSEGLSSSLSSAAVSTSTQLRTLAISHLIHNASSRRDALRAFDMHAGEWENERRIKNDDLSLSCHSHLIAPKFKLSALQTWLSFRPEAKELVLGDGRSGLIHRKGRQGCVYVSLNSAGPDSIHTVKSFTIAASPEQVSFITPDSESDVGRVSPSYNASEGGLKLMAHSEEASVTVPWTSYCF